MSLTAPLLRRCSLGPFAHGYVHHALVGAPQHRELRSASGLERSHVVEQVAHLLEWLTVDSGNNFAGFEPGAISRPALNDPRNHHTARTPVL
jgi:hypothetical protein